MLNNINCSAEDLRLILFCFVLLLLSLEFVDKSHLFVDLDQEVFNMAVDIINVPCHLRLDVLGSVCISERILSFIKVLA